MKPTIAKKEEVPNAPLQSTINVYFIILYYDGHMHVMIFWAELLDSLLECLTIVNLTNGPMGVDGNRNSVEIVMVKGC